MKRLTKLAVAITTALTVTGAYAEESITEAIKGGKTNLEFNLRYESVSQDNALKDADALTLKSVLSYSTADYQGLSATIGYKATQIVMGQGDYSVGPANYKKGEYSVIADPETTELDQAFVQYKTGGFTAKAGRQVIALGGQRFVGHVGWRQDRQTFDGVTLKYSKDALSLSYGYINQRNRIFAEAADLDSKDHLFNADYKTSLGTASAYAYLLEVDNSTDNALNTYGARFAGGTKAGDLPLNYAFEYAVQSSESGTTDYDASYLLAEFGATFSGINATVGYEVLGSDDGMYGFSTPLATLHKFNGWSDQFLGTPAAGLQDIYAVVKGKVGKSGSWLVKYHQFSADESTATVDDLGSELDLLYTHKFSKNYSGGIKYAAYSAGDSAAGKVDTDKAWVWVSAKF